MLKNLVVLAAKLESTEGTAVSLTASDAKFKPRGLKIIPTIEMFEPDTKRASFSRWPSIPGKRMGAIEFELDLFGTNSDNSAPPLELFFQICGMKKATSGTGFTYTTSSVWDPATMGSSDHKSATVAFYQNGSLQRICGARGTFTLVMQAGLPVAARFRVIGCIEDFSDTTILSSISYDANQLTPPVFAGAGLSIGGLSSSEAVLSRAEIDVGNAVSMRTDANTAGGYKSAYIGDRKPTLKLDPEYLLIAQGHDFWSTWKAGTTAALTCSIGGSGSQRVKIDAPAVQYQDVPRGERDDLVTAEVSAMLCGSSAGGDDELVITLGA